MFNTPTKKYMVTIKHDAANSRIRTYSIGATGPNYLSGKSDLSLNSFHPIKIAYSPTGGVFMLPYWGSAPESTRRRLLLSGDDTKLCKYI